MTFVIFRSIIAAAACLSLMGTVKTAQAQSFNGLRGGKKMIIKRLLPPAVNLNRKRIGVVSRAQGGASPEVATVLKTRVLTAIQKDPNFIVDEKNPETRLSFTVTAFRVEALNINDTSTNPPTTCRVFAARADVSYQAIEVATGVPQDSENLTFSIGGTKRTSTKGGLAALSSLNPLKKRAPICEQYGTLTQSEATDELYGRLVHQMTQRAAPVDEDVEVALPGGKLKDLSALAIEKRWPVLLEKAEQMPKLEKTDEDASRLYLIALAHEATAYDTRREAFELERRRVSGVGSNSKEIEVQEQKFFVSAKGHLEQAAQSYRDAISGDPGEKELKKPEGRIEQAVRLYATIERQRKDYQANLKKAESEKTRLASAGNSAEKAKEAVTRSAPESKPAAPSPAAAGPNAEILKLCVEHLDEGTIVDFIQNFPNPQFDLSADALIALKRTCGDSSGKYQAAMRAKLAAKRAAAPKTAPKPKAESPAPPPKKGK